MTTENIHVSPDSPGSGPTGSGVDLSGGGNLPPLRLNVLEILRMAPTGDPAKELLERGELEKFVSRMKMSFECLRLDPNADSVTIESRYQQMLTASDPESLQPHLKATLGPSYANVQSILRAAAADILPEEHRAALRHVLKLIRGAARLSTELFSGAGLEVPSTSAAEPQSRSEGASTTEGASVPQKTPDAGAQPGQAQAASLVAPQTGVGVVKTDRQRLRPWERLKAWCIHHSKNIGEVKWAFGLGGLAAAGITSHLIWYTAAKLAVMSGVNALILGVAVVGPSIAVCAGLYIGAAVWKRGAAQVKAIIQHRLAGVIRLAQQGWEDPQGIMKLLKEGRNEFAKELGIFDRMKELDDILRDPRKVQLTAKAKQLLEVEQTTAGLVYVKGTDPQGNKIKVPFREEDLDTTEKLIPVLEEKGAIKKRGDLWGMYEVVGDGTVFQPRDLIAARDTSQEYRAKLDQIFADDKVHRVQGTWDPLKLGFHDWDLSERCRQYCTAVLTLHEFSGQYKTDSKLTKSQIRSVVLGELAGVPLQTYKDEATGYVVGNLIQQVYVRKHVCWAALEGLLNRTLLSGKPGQAAAAGGFIVFAPLVLNLIPVSISPIGGKVVAASAKFMMDNGPLWIAIGSVALGSVVGLGAYVRRRLKHRSRD